MEGGSASPLHCRVVVILTRQASLSLFSNVMLPTSVSLFDLYNACMAAKVNIVHYGFRIQITKDLQILWCQGRK